MNDPIFPPVNTTTITLHFTDADGTPRLDSNFTVQGMVHGQALSKWLQVLLSEHGNAALNASVDVWHHSPDGSFEHSEITCCRQYQ